MLLARGTGRTVQYYKYTLDCIRSTRMTFVIVDTLEGYRRQQSSWSMYNYNLINTTVKLDEHPVKSS